MKITYIVIIGLFFTACTKQNYSLEYCNRIVYRDWFGDYNIPKECWHWYQPAKETK